jgi:hypothetical protein
MVKLKGYPLLNNIKLLYFIFILAIINVGGFIYIKDNQSIFLFAVISLIIYCFNSNMIIVLLSTMIIVNTLIFLNRLNGPIERGPIEGYKNEDEEEEEEVKEEEVKEGLVNEEEDNVVGELSDLKDESGTKEIKEKIKKIIPILKTNYDSLSLDINNMNKKINTLTSITG